MRDSNPLSEKNFQHFRRMRASIVVLIPWILVQLTIEVYTVMGSQDSSLNLKTQTGPYWLIIVLFIYVSLQPF